MVWFNPFGMTSSFDINIPENLTFHDYLHICQTARVWADGYDLKSLPRLLSTLAPNLTVDYTSVNPSWGVKDYLRDDFATLWMSDEHLGNRALATQHLLGAPYFTYVGPLRDSKDLSKGILDSGNSVEEVHVSWQILASHARRIPVSSSTSTTSTATREGEDPIPGQGTNPSTTGDSRLEYDSSPMTPLEPGTSDHRSYMEHRFIKVETNGTNIDQVGSDEPAEQAKGGTRKQWKIAGIKPIVIYATGDFMRVRRNEGVP